MKRGSEKLDAAADAVERGWVQGVGRMIDSEGNECVCLSTALVVGSQGFLGGSARSDLASVIGTFHWVLWNDEPGRTKAEVVAALRKAAALARSREVP